jgi:ribosomal protein L40E
MSSNRSKFTLDEQSFQGLLSAAFIVQEYNDRRNNGHTKNGRVDSDQLPPAKTAPAEPEARRESESPGVCSHCNAPKPAEASRCESCGRDELRPGERLQRNWASLWLMSQEQDLWPERFRENRESTQKDAAPPAVERRPLPDLAHDSAGSAFVAPPEAIEITGQEKVDTIRHLRESAENHPALGTSALVDAALDTPALDAPAFVEPTFVEPLHNEAAPRDPAPDTQAISGAEAESKSAAEAIAEVTDHLTGESFVPENADLAVQPFQLSESDDSLPSEVSTGESTEGVPAEMADASHPASGSLLQHLADLRVTLRFHRADLYLGAAVFVAALALLWPAASSPRRTALGPWERALVTLGLAEVPEPATHLQGDPAIEVWVDPHTALYYCPGEEPYGKTADGRLSSQHDAQMDRFEPASRSACE